MGGENVVGESAETSAPVRVVGYLGDAAPVSAAARRAVAEADLVVGGRRHLDAFDVPEDRRLVLGPLGPAIEALQARGDRRAVVVASGDPGFFGIVRRLRHAGLDLLVEPAPSALALAFGRLGLPREDAQIVSAHGRDLRRALNVVRAHDTVGVMTTVGAGLREIAAGLTAGAASWPRRLALLEHLGEAGERVRWFTPDEALALDPSDIAEPNVVVAVRENDGADHTDQTGGAGAWTGPGMPWRLSDRGRRRDEERWRDDVLAALAVGILGPMPGDLVLVGDGLEGVAGAVDERGAAVLRTDAGPAPVGVATCDGVLPTYVEPDLVCVTSRHLPVLARLLGAPGTHRWRGVVVVTDGAALVSDASALTGLLGDVPLRQVDVPALTPLADPVETAAGGRNDAGGRAGHRLLVATRDRP